MERSSSRSILGPLLFTHYVNDLPQVVMKGRIKQYVDDTALYCANDNSIELLKDLNEDLDRVAGWVKQNGLQLNEAKTQMLLLSRKKRTKELNDVVVRLRGQPVTRNEKIKYLGVWIDDALNWSDCIEAIRQKCF